MPLEDATIETETGILVKLLHAKSEEALEEFLLAFFCTLVQYMAKINTVTG